MESQDPAPASPGHEADRVAPVDPGELDRAESELAEVEGALGRIDAGTYGRCEVCDAPLPDDLLAAEPTARRCPTHA